MCHHLRGYVECTVVVIDGEEMPAKTDARCLDCGVSTVRVTAEARAPACYPRVLRVLRDERTEQERVNA